MSFLAKLEMDSKEYNILTVEYDITQMMDQHNRPNGAPKGGLVQLTIETGSDNHLVEWALKHSMIKDGKIVFYRRDANSKMKSVEFKDAFCVYLKEIFTADGKNPMVTRLTISARELKISNQSIKNLWAGMSSSASNENSNTSNDEITTFNAAGQD
jgi:Hemolysin coregulated protein Hcp (TssD)